MKKGVIALIVIVLAIAIFSFSDITRTTGYVSADDLDRIIKEAREKGNPVEVSERGVQNSPRQIDTKTIPQEDLRTSELIRDEIEKQESGSVLDKLMRAFKIKRDDRFFTLAIEAIERGDLEEAEKILLEGYNSKNIRIDLAELAETQALSGNNAGDFVALQAGMPSVCPSIFIRGDSNDDGNVDIGDAIYLLTYLFQSGPNPSCGDMADSNDDNFIDIGDSIFILNYLFGGGPSPYLPYPGAGYDEQGEGAGQGPINGSLNYTGWSLCNGINDDGSTGDTLVDEGENCTGPTNSTNNTFLACNAVLGMCEIQIGISPNLHGCVFAGQNCSTNSTGPTNTTNLTHLECVGLQCLPVPGAGVNQCTTSLDCMNSTTNTTNISMPDLRISNMDYNVTNITNSTNSSLDVAITVQNIGTATAGASTTRVDIYSGGFNIASRNLATSSISPGGFSTIVVGTFSLAPGVYGVNSQVDFFNVVVESDETNNNGSIASFVI